MASEKVRGILLSRTELSAVDVDTMSEAEAWRAVYSLPKPTPKKDLRTRVCFTGFGVSEKAELTELAERAGHVPTAGVTKKLSLLVCGENAGPVKMEKAGAQGVNLVTGAEYRELVTATD